MITDQRTHHRVSFFVGGDLYRAANGDKTARVIVRDVSFAGARVETLEALSLGETIFMDFEICGKFPFNKVPALVARVNRQGGSYLAGVAFTRGEDRRRVRQALTYLIESSI